ncbi:hypothetical protein [Brevibacterium renqingii]|uniref:hypothetical protein n=1 Tax=Brevibacterium renqingii TaxID=2776916 RepID=UPI001ADF7AAE|nr:hypothetical protein [Brevibacterium renqingii]
MLLLFLICAIFIVLGAAVAWQRSLIPLELHGKVTELAAVEVEQPGVDDWVEFHLGPTRFAAGIASLSCISDGVEVEKKAWSRQVAVDGQPCVLPWPRQAIADSVVPCAILALIALIIPHVLGPRHRHRHAQAQEGTTPDERRG